MSAASTMGFPSRYKELPAPVRGAMPWVAGLAIADALILAGPGSGLRLLGGLLLFCVIPGQGLVALVLRGDEGRLKRFLLGMAASYALSNLALLGLSPVRGGLSRASVLVVVLDVVSLAFWAVSSLVRRDRVNVTPAGANAAGRVVWLHVGILLAVLGATRFIGLGYSQFNTGDETPILALVTRLIEGHGSVLLEHTKGPVEVLTTLAFTLFGNGYREWVLRAPFALASVVSILLIYEFGREMFSARVGFVAGLLASIEGVYLAITRWAQFQGIVLLLSVAAVYCFWGALAREAGRARAPLLILGSGFFGLALLSHFDGIDILPVLALLYLAQSGGRWRRDLGLLAICGAVVVAIAAPYYVPFAVSARLGSLRHYIGGERLGLGGGLYNNLQAYVLQDSLFRNSIYYVVLLLAALAASLAAILRREVKRNRATFLAWGVFGLGLVASMAWPDALRVGPLNVGILFCVPVGAALFLSRGLPVSHRMLWVWFLGVLIAYGFLCRLPYLHWYKIVPAWSLLAGVAVDGAFGRLRTRAIRAVAWSAVAACFVLCAGYTYIVVIRQVPEYAWTFPQSKQFPYWSPLEAVPGQQGVGYIGMPHQQGWKVISYLYRTGQMRGTVRVTDGLDWLRWYVGQPLENDLSSRYIVYSGSARGDFDLADIERTYRVTGRVLVHDRPTLLIYERNDLAGSRKNVVDYRFEDYEPSYDDLASLDERVHYDSLPGERPFYRAAGLIEQSTGAGEAVIFTDRRQVAPFSQYYGSGLPYVTLDRDSPPDLDRYLAGRGSNQPVSVVFWGVPGSVERATWEEWLGRQPAERCERAWQGSGGLAICAPTGPLSLHLLQDSRLSGHVELLGYELVPDAPAHAVRVTLYWAASSVRPTEDYTVFVHLLDGNGDMIGQQDGQPSDGRSPTSMWRGDKVIRDERVIPAPEGAAGEYWVEVGMYLLATGERLPSSGPGALPDGRIRLPTPVEMATIGPR